jgi:Flp pilus assembly protein TadD
MNLGVMQIRTGQTDAAEASLKHAIEVNPKEMSSRLLLAGLYQSHNRFPDAEQQLQTAIQADPQNPDPRAAMARLYLEEGKKNDAENFLRRAKQDFPNNSAGYRMLGDFYYLTGDVDNALAEYAALNHDHPKDAQVKKNYIELLILKNRDADARKLNDEFLKADPSDNDALVYRAQLQLRAGDANSAVSTLQTVNKNDPNNATAHYQLGAAYQQLGNLDRARSEWLDAMRLRPNQVQTVRALASLSLRQGDMTTLEQTSNQMINLQPASPEGYALHAIVNINRDKFDEAEKDARKSIEVAPQSSFGYVQMGNLKFAQKQYKDAAQYFQQSLDRNANSTDALRGLMNTHLATKKPDQAVAAVQSQIAKSPKNSEFYDLLGVAMTRNKDVKNAEAAFAKALELDPNNFDAIINLGEVEASNGETDQAIALYEQAVKGHPHEAPLDIFLGRLYESKRDWKKAESAYQNALVIKPDDPLASNSLANVMVQDGGNYDVALSLAQTARHGLPDSPFVADTLGWIYYQKGAYTSAVSLLEEALKLREKSKLPDSADMHYHLGLAYEKTDQRKLARQQLERVLQIDPNYSAAGDVKKQLSQLKS